MPNAATAHLESYGFVKGDDKGWVIHRASKPKTKYEVVSGGFHRFEREDGVWRQYPYIVHVQPDDGSPRHDHNGLAFDVKQQTLMGGRLQPVCFEWVWPDAEIAKVYGGASGG